jgi:hypothetical protein
MMRRWSSVRAGFGSAVTALLLAACAHQPAREAVLAPQGAPGGRGAASRSVDLSGTWQLDARSTGREMPYDRGGMMPGTRVGMPGGGSFGGRTGGYPRDGLDERMRRDSLPQDSLARDSIMRELGRLVIAQTDTALTFTVGRAAPLTVFTDWRETRIPGRYGPWDVTFVTGQWHGTRFEVRRVLPSHTVIVESYALSRNGRQLTVTTRIAEKSDEGGEILPREGRRVYDRVMAPPATGDSTP